MPLTQYLNVNLMRFRWWGIRFEVVSCVYIKYCIDCTCRAGLSPIRGLKHLEDYGSSYV